MDKTTTIRKERIQPYKLRVKFSMPQSSKIREKVIRRGMLSKLL
jgi:hypothetical protein